MPRALWKGAISFGLVYVPVEVHTASKENSLPLHMLDDRDFSPMGFQRINKKTGKEVEWSHIVKGFLDRRRAGTSPSPTPISSTPTSRRRRRSRSTHSWATAEIPALYYEKPYYLAPGQGR